MAKGTMGGFGTAFATSFAAMMKAIEDERHNRAMEEHYARMDWNAGAETRNAEAARRAGEASAGAPGTSGAAGGAGTAAIDPDAATKLAKVLTDRGVKPDVAAGAVAGMMGESGAKLDPTAFNSKDPHGGAGGIAQWNGPRLIGPDGMLAFAKSRGVDVNPSVPTDSKKVPFDIQAEFLGKELDGKYSGVLKGLQVTNTGEEGLTNWVNNFEVPADKTGAIAQRRQYIQPVQTAIRNGPKPAATDTSTASAAPGAAAATSGAPAAAPATTAAATPTKGPNKGKTPAPAPVATDATAGAQARADTGRGSYQVAGTVPIGLSEEDAAKAKADLDAHRAAPNALPAPLDEDKDLRPSAQPSAQPAPSAPLIQIGGFHPENIFQHHPPGSATLGPVFSDRPNGQAAPDNPSEHGDAPPDVRSPEDNYDATHRIVPVRPDAPMTGVRGNPQFNAVRPEPAIPTTPQAPNTVRPDAPMDSVHGNPLFNAVRPEPPANASDATPVPNYVRPEGEITRTYPSWPGTEQGSSPPPPTVTPPPRPKNLGKSSAADKPSKNAQPVSATRSAPASAIPNNPTGNNQPQDPRFTQISAPNQNPGTGRGMLGQQGDGERQTTALDLSHLWGSNPPLAQRQASAPAAAPIAVRRPDDDMAGVTDEMVMGSAKGGPITQRVNRYANGGAIPSRPAMGFATGGTATMSANPQTQALNNMGSGIAQTAYRNRQAQAFAANPDVNTAYQKAMGALNTNVYGSASPDLTGMDYKAVGDKYNALTPDQQSWFNNANSTITGAQQYATSNPALAKMMLGSIGNYPASPAAAAPAPAAPAPAPAPAPVAPTVVPVANSENPNYVDPVAIAKVDPTTETSTGAFKMPDMLTAKSYDPNVDSATGAGFANTSNVGGTDYSVGTDSLLKTDASDNKIYGYSDDEDQATKRNQTILSAKGGAIPKLPAINRYDDGGDVGPTATGTSGPPGTPQQAPPPVYFNPATYAQAGAPVGKGMSANSANTAVAGAIPSLPMARGGAVGFDDGGAVDEDTGMPADDMVGYAPASGNARSAAPQFAPPDQQAPPPQANPYATATRPQDVHPDLPSWTPQIKDPEGNPSRGVIGAIAGGLHYLASQLGLGGEQQGAIASNPSMQQNRSSFARGEGVPGAPMPDHEEVNQIHSSIDPKGQLSNGMRTLAGMEAVRNYYLVSGNPTKADQMAASMMQYSVSLSQHHGDEAVKAYYKGDLHTAVNELNNASDVVGDGTNFKARVSEDGQHVEVSNTDLNGKEVWSQKDVSPQAILGAAIHAKDGSLAWHMYEAQAAKYDPQTAAIIADRRQRANWDHQQGVADARQAAKDKAAKDQSDTESGILTSMFGGDGSNPTGNSAPATAATPAIPPQPTQLSQPSQASPPTEATPPTTPSAPTAAPQAAPPDADVGYQPSPLPTQAGVTNPDAPAAGAQSVSADTGPTVLPNPAKDPRFSQLSAQLQQKALDIYRQSVNERKTWETNQATQTREDTRAQRIAAAPGLAEAQREKFETAKDNSSREWDLTKPRPRAETNAVFNLAPNETGVATGKEPTTYMAEAMGYVKKDPAGTAAMVPDTDLLNKTFSPDEQTTIANAMVNGHYFSPGTTAPMITKAITGAMTNPDYVMTPTMISPDKQYGVPRVSVSVTHKGSRTGVTFVLPVEDYKNLQGLYQDRQEAQTKKNQPGPAVTAPTPNAPAFPGSTPGGAPTTAFGAAKPYKPEEHPWIEQALGRGKGSAIPSFPVRPTDDQGGRGYIR